ncbi:hypothetical protein DXG01_015595 [Tephrocybe rancida]|nr:hypothetical protein DXG01_015595 [Tephrocybe rancida]
MTTSLSCFLTLLNKLGLSAQKWTLDYGTFQLLSQIQIFFLWYFMDNPNKAVDSWASSTLFNYTSAPKNCSKSYLQPFNFTTASKDFELGVPNRIWWDPGTANGNITLHVTTLDPRSFDYTVWHTLTSTIQFSSITEKDGQGVGFDWIPSIAPDANFILTLGDDRGIGSGGSLHGSITPSSFLCAYQLSGAYTVLQRVILYLLFLFGTIGLFTASPWMTGPFLGGAMASTGSMALHSIILMASSRKASQKGTIDLDRIAIFQMLSVCLYLCAPLIIGSYQLRQRTGEGSATAMVVCAWAILIVVGFFCSIIPDSETPLQPCAPYNTTTPTGTLLTIATNTSLCADLCLTKSSLVRDLGTAQMNDANITIENIFHWLYFWGYVVGILCTIWVTMMIVITFVTPNKPTDVFNEVFHSKRHRKSEAGTVCTLLFVLVAAPVTMVVQVCYGEHLLATKAALRSEKSFVVGQWGPWVAIGLASVSTVFLVAAGNGSKETPARSMPPELAEPDKASAGESPP